MEPKNLSGMPYGNQSNDWDLNDMPYGNQNNSQTPIGMPYNSWNNNWNNEWPAMEYRGGIYYPDYYGTEMEDQSDVRYMKELYPDLARRIQVLVDEESDRMEYDGSMMYDEYPDRVMIYRIVQQILEQLLAEGELDFAESPVNEEMGESDADSQLVEAMQNGGNCRGGNCRNSQFEDLVQVILLNEIFKRRANRRNRRRRYW